MPSYSHASEKCKFRGEGRIASSDAHRESENAEQQCERKNKGKRQTVNAPVGARAALGGKKWSPGQCTARRGYQCTAWRPHRQTRVFAHGGIAAETPSADPEIRDSWCFSAAFCLKNGGKTP
ncbi:hypothetical protein GFD17_01260 [Bifidobacterium sp. SMB2]|uniref:Uncharacterized protein n=1 Tax=Bifidobacterium saimiriisciurei TaxID=2661627 RepID=A0ABX0CC47_9BIFI|nr:MULTISPECIES: hypothetical protein [Bifidobacterium]NEG95406.1 hypothetical protein [Bifidobacterium sp. SMB2]NEH11410.1 hypothetical protein [Bifidobacterium saimiriisciurei]